MKTTDVLNKVAYQKTKQELLNLISKSQLHPMDVYKLVKELSAIDLKRSKLNCVGISSSIVMTALVGSLSISLGSKLLIGTTGIGLSILITEYLKNKISITDLKEMLENVQIQLTARTISK